MEDMEGKPLRVFLPTEGNFFSKPVWVAKCGKKFFLFVEDAQEAVFTLGGGWFARPLYTLVCSGGLATLALLPPLPHSGVVRLATLGRARFAHPFDPHPHPPQSE